MAPHIQREREERGAREREKEALKQMKETRREETTHPEQGVAKNVQRQTEVTQNWIQRLEERQAHPNLIQDIRRGT